MSQRFGFYESLQHAVTTLLEFGYGRSKFRRSNFVYNAGKNMIRLHHNRISIPSMKVNSKIFLDSAIDCSIRTTKNLTFIIFSHYVLKLSKLRFLVKI